MSKAIVTESKLTAIANAVRNRFGVTGQKTLDELAEIITPPEIITPHWNATEAASATSSTNTLTGCTVGNLLVACFTCRAVPVTLSSGWILLSVSNYNSADSNKYRIGWAYKYAESTSESLTVQTSEGRIYINIIELPLTAEITDGGYEYRNNSSESSMTVTKGTALTIWGAFANTWTSGNWQCSSIESSNRMVQANTSSPRLLCGLDQSTDTSVTLTARYPSIMIVGKLTITGIPCFEGGMGA